MQIITAPTFAKQFPIEGAKLKNVPKGYDAALPAAENIKHKAWDAGCAISGDCTLHDGNFPCHEAV